MYKDALDALDYVEMIFPLKGKVGKARISEREGKFDEAIMSMLQIRDDWKSGKVQLTVDSSVDLNLDIAWTIVSGRLDNYRPVGREACEDARKGLQNKFDTIRDSNRTFQLLNVLANYEEWEGNPQGAIDNYKKALQIPGVYQTKLSNLFVNKGIALRQMKLLKESILNIKKGVEMKFAIGDADQLPVALHNLAQTCIELAFATSDKNIRINFLLKANQHAKDGLCIQSQTDSVKKRGQLLAEKFVSEFELAKLNKKIDAPPVVSLKAVQDWLLNEIEAGRGSSYDCKVVVGELLGCLDEFQANTIEEAVVWHAL